MRQLLTIPYAAAFDLLLRDKPRDALPVAVERVSSGCSACTVADSDISNWLDCIRKYCPGSPAELEFVADECPGDHISEAYSWMYIGTSSLKNHLPYFKWSTIAVTAEHDASKCDQLELATGFASRGNTPSDCPSLTTSFQVRPDVPPANYPTVNLSPSLLTVDISRAEAMIDVTQYDTIQLGSMKSECHPALAGDIVLRSTWFVPLPNSYEVPASQVDQCPTCVLKSEDPAGFQEWVTCYETEELIPRCSEARNNIYVHGYTCADHEKSAATFTFGRAGLDIPAKFRITAIEVPLKIGGTCTAAKIGYGEASEPDSDYCHTPGGTFSNVQSIHIKDATATLNFNSDEVVFENYANGLMTISTEYCDIETGIAKLITEYIAPMVESPPSTEEQVTLDPHQSTESEDRVRTNVSIGIGAAIISAAATFLL